MRKMMLIMPLVFALVFGYGVVKSSAGEWMSSEDEPGMAILIGAAVKNHEGEDLGFINDFVSDPYGRISFAILLHGTYEEYGDEGRRVAVPFAALSCGFQDCVLDSSKEQLDSAPVFISKSDLEDLRMAEDIYRYFGQQPYWTEEETMEHEGMEDFPRPQDYDLF
jgi:hypothetical protein